MPHHTQDEIQICAICNKEFTRGNVNRFIGGRCNECSDKLHAEWRKGMDTSNCVKVGTNKEHDENCPDGCGYCRKRRGIKKNKKS